MHFSSSHNSSRRPQDSFVHRIANDPYLDWLIMVIAAVILSVILVGVGFVTYNNTEARLSAPVDTATQSQRALFDGQSLDRVLREFAARADEQNMLTKGYAGVADPSL